MTLISSLALFGVLAASPQGAPPQDAPARPSVEAMQTQATQVFGELETKVEPRKESDGTVTLVFTTGQTTGQLYQYLDDAGKVESLRLNVGYDVTGNVSMTKLNTFNEKRRFGKAFVDRDGDPFLVSDLDVQFGSNPGILRAWIIRFRALIPTFEREVLTP